jgi:hypothetical protein
MASTNEDLRESEKATTEATPQETDVAVVDKETLSLHGDHGSEASSGVEPQAVALPHGDPDDEPPSETPIESTGTSTVEYSVFTVTQKKMIVLTASLASLFSPMASAIYCKLSSPYLAQAHSHTTRSITHNNGKRPPRLRRKN